MHPPLVVRRHGYTGQRGEARYGPYLDFNGRIQHSGLGDEGDDVVVVFAGSCCGIACWIIKVEFEFVSKPVIENLMVEDRGRL